MLWQAAYDLEPWGEYRADLRMGTLATVIAEPNRNREVKPKAFTPADFMPDFYADPHEQERSALNAFIKATE
jgi:hypothetical protein